PGRARYRFRAVTAARPECPSYTRGRHAVEQQDAHRRIRGQEAASGNLPRARAPRVADVSCLPGSPWVKLVMISAGMAARPIDAFVKHLSFLMECVSPISQTSDPTSEEEKE